MGDRVLLFNSRLKIFSGKLKSRWSGPFTIVQVFPYGTVELSQNSGPNFKVNGHRIKHYFGGDIPRSGRGEILWVSQLSKRSPYTQEEIEFGGRVKRRDPKQALRGRHPMLIQYSRIVKALDSVIFNSSFTSSASFWEFIVARDEKWVPFSERFKVRSTNVRLETTVPQKEETFQVVIDLVKNSSCFKAFTISTDVLEIFMQQFWTILDTCPRVEGVNFTDVPDDDATLAFLIKLGYKGPLYKHTNMFGMFYKENVDYPELIWEDLDYHIDHEKEKRSWRENMPFPDSQ
ncbi:hypothetical protein Tco_0852173, partial [Tanacetum coccineum]